MPRVRRTAHISRLGLASDLEAFLNVGQDPLTVGEHRARQLKRMMDEA